MSRLDSRGTAAVAAILLLFSSLFAAIPVAYAKGGANCSTPPAPGNNYSGCNLKGSTMFICDHVGCSPINCNNCDFQGANLEGVNFQGYFVGANFQGANLKGAYITEMTIPGMGFPPSDFTGADFNGANLKGAYFQGSIATGADFKGANLQSVSFAGTDLSGAQLQGANIKGMGGNAGTIFTGADMKGDKSPGCTLPTTYTYPNPFAAGYEIDLCGSAALSIGGLFVSGEVTVPMVTCQPGLGSPSEGQQDAFTVGSGNNYQGYFEEIGVLVLCYPGADVPQYMLYYGFFGPSCGQNQLGCEGPTLLSSCQSMGGPTCTDSTGLSVSPGQTFVFQVKVVSTRGSCVSGQTCFEVSAYSTSSPTPLFSAYESQPGVTANIADFIDYGAFQGFPAVAAFRQSNVFSGAAMYEEFCIYNFLCFTDPVYGLGGSFSSTVGVYDLTNDGGSVTATSPPDFGATSFGLEYAPP